MSVNKNKHKNKYLADSMLLFGIGIALFYWMFVSFVKFLGAPDLPVYDIFFGSTFELYERLIVTCLFIIFGSHSRMNIKLREEAEETIKKSEEKYRTILESIGEGYYELDLYGTFIFVNQSMLDIFAMPENELIGMNIYDYLDPESAEKLRKIFYDLQLSGKFAATFEFDLSIQDKFKKIVDLSAAAKTDEKNEPCGYRGICLDITEKRLLERTLISSLKDVEEARSGVVLGLAKLAECRDSDTGKHLERIREFCKILAAGLINHPDYTGYVTEAYVDDIYHSSILHDIGKVGIPDAILMKKGKLEDDEYAQMKNHAIIGGQALSHIDKQFKDKSFLRIAKEIAYYHHEKWDGTGYPKGLAGTEIPLSARITSLADVYDALASKRCYKESMEHDTVLKIILEGAGTSFDPDIVDVFVAKADKFMRVSEELKG